MGTYGLMGKQKVTCYYIKGTNHLGHQYIRNVGVRSSSMAKWITSLLPLTVSANIIIPSMYEHKHMLLNLQGNEFFV